MPRGRSSIGAAAERPRRKRGEGKERILQEALEQFARLGFEATSTQDIARAAGVSQSVVIYHFETKDELWKAAMRRLFGALGDHPSMQDPAFAGRSARDRFAALLKGFMRATIAHPYLSMILYREGLNGGPRLDWLLTELADPHYQSFFAAIRALQEEGAIKIFNPVLLALAIHGAGATLFNVPHLSRSLLGEDPFADSVTEEQAELFMSFVMDGLTVRPT